MDLAQQEDFLSTIGAENTESEPEGKEISEKEIQTEFAELKKKVPAKTFREYVKTQRSKKSNSQGEKENKSKFEKSQTYEPSSLKKDENKSQPADAASTTGSRSGNRQTYASTVRKVEPLKRWGDLSSSEDEKMNNALNSLVRTKISEKPSIDLPEDFQSYFPTPYNLMKECCDKFGWEINLSKPTLAEGGIKDFKEENDGSVTIPNNDAATQAALLTLYAAAACLSLKPEEISKHKENEVAVTYFCSLLAKIKLGSNNRDYWKIAFKSGDGGEKVFKERIISLTRTGNMAISKVHTALVKLLHKRAKSLDDSCFDKNTKDIIKQKSFTTIEGMMQNSYTSNYVDAWEEIEVVKNNKRKVEKQKVKKLQVNVPNISLTRNVFTAKEITNLERLKKSFNDRKSVIEKRLRDKQDDEDFFLVAKVTKEVIDEAYAKLKPLKAAVGRRMQTIRSKATEIAKGVKPNPAQWEEGRAYMLKNITEISDDVYKNLEW